jgi:8-oxo-dGTP diphosphatase
MEAPRRIACALLFDSGRVLLARRKSGISNEGLWEFPGGKVEAGEGDQACVARELKEEFGLDARVGTHFMDNEFPPSGILLVSYFAKALGPFTYLLDHDSIAFEYPRALDRYAFSPADIPIAQALRASGAPRFSS